MENIFQEKNGSIAGATYICAQPSEQLQNQIRQWNDSQDRRWRSLKRIALLFVAVMFVLWIGGDLIGMPGAFELITGLCTLGGYWIVLLIGSFWLGRSSVRALNEDMVSQAISEMFVPGDAETLEILVPDKKEPAGWLFGNPGGGICANSLMMAWRDEDALYLADVLRTVRIPLEAFYKIEQETQKCRINQWLQETTPQKLKKQGVKVSRPNRILIQYNIVEVYSGEEYLCMWIPTYETDKLRSLIQGKGSMQ